MVRKSHVFSLFLHCLLVYSCSLWYFSFFFMKTLAVGRKESVKQQYFQSIINNRAFKKIDTGLDMASKECNYITQGFLSGISPSNA